MYIVLMAMLALNISSDVLDGFSQVEEGLSRSNENIAARNDNIYNQLEQVSRLNPEKGEVWFEKAVQMRNATSSLNTLIDSLKLAIVIEADGNEGNLDEIKNQEDLDAASVIMLSPQGGKGKMLRKRIENYREYVASLISDSTKIENVKQALSTAPVVKKGTVTPMSWEESLFDHKPVIAAVTMLTKLQNDIRYAEGEALANLLDNVDAGDVRVNELNAFVIPQSRNVMRGGKYVANIVLAAVDTTQRPSIFINGTKLPGDRGLFETKASATGTFTYNGYLELPHGDGTVTRHNFSSSYTVIEPTATVSATMMNVMYAGIDNPISISVPGVVPSDISATMTNGTLTRRGDNWVARPAKIGATATITVTATIDGQKQTVATTDFKVRRLPDPAPYISLGDTRYKGGKPIAKAQLLAAPGIEAAIDDDLLNINFRVLSFETTFFDSMGNAMPEVSSGASFSQRQKDAFKRLSRGKRFFISRVRAIGPDGIERDISPMEVIVN